MVSFSDRLKLLRSQKNMSQNQLGEELDIPRTTISSWESGSRFADVAAILKLSDYFGVSSDYILGRSNVRNPEEAEAATKKIYEAVQDDPELADFLEKLINREDLRQVSKLLKDLPQDAVLRSAKVIKALE